MGKKCIVRAGSLALILFACSWTSLAQVSYPIEFREWEFSAFGGVTSSDDFEFSTTVLGSTQQSSRSVGMEYDSGYQAGLRLTEYFNDFWAADLEYSFSNQPLRFTNLAPGIPSFSASNTAHQFSYNISLIPVGPTARIRPYGKAGAGATLFYLGESSKEQAALLGLQLRDSWEFMFDWGAGVKFLVRDQFALNVDLGDRITGIPSYGLPVNARVVNGVYQPGVAGHGYMNNWHFNLGLSYQFDDYW